MVSGEVYRPIDRHYVSQYQTNTIWKISSTSESYQRCEFSWDGRNFCHEVFFRIYFPLAVEVHNRLFIDSLRSTVVERIKKLLLGFTQSKYSPWPSVLTSPSWIGEN